MSSGDWLICAIDKISAPARLALSAVSAKKPYADALADFPTGNSLAYGVNLSNNLMAGYARKSNAGQDPVYGGGVRVANSAGFNADPDLTCGWFLKWTLGELQQTRTRDFNCSVCCAHARLIFTKNMTPRSIAGYRPNGLIFRMPRDCGDAVLSEGVGAVDHPAAPGHSPVNS